MNKIKKGDTVKVLSGDDKGKTGAVQYVYPKKERVIVAGVNMMKKAQRRDAAVRCEPKRGLLSAKVQCIGPRLQSFARTVASKRALDLKLLKTAPNIASVANAATL